jgi:aldehyde dehydrogenase (NAD+)
MSTPATHPEIISYSPRTGLEIGRYRDSSAADVEQAVARARVGATSWQSIGFSGRKEVLRRWAALIASRIDEIAQLISEETGKPLSDSYLEISLTLSHLTWAAKKASRYLRTSHRAPGILVANMSAQVHHVPFGVVGVLGPWNYPIFTPMGSIAYALAAGNTVVFKPSEFTPGVGHWLGETFNEVAPNANVFFVVTGGPQTGVALTQASIDKLAFTGSSATAKKVAATCANRMIPVVLECGGTDPAIIDKDADLSKAVESVLWGAMSNGGQTCIGIERVYVHEDVADAFVAEITKQASTLQAGVDYGPSTMPAQLKVIDSHIKDAATRGATFVVGSVDSVQPPYVEPTIMIDIPEDSLAVAEETFGPTLTINRVATMSEAIQRANVSKYGLGASVWSKKSGKAIAAQLQCGMVSINSVIAFAGVSTLPFGGTKDSGYGRIHGPEGLREFTYPRSVVRPIFDLPMSFTTFKRKPSTDRLLKKVTTLLNR